MYDEHEFQEKEERISKHKIRLKKCLNISRGTLTVIGEMAEGGSIFYSFYDVTAYNPDFEGKQGYAFVVVGATIGGLFEILHLTGLSSHRKYAHYEAIKTAIAGGNVAAILLQGFFPETTNFVILGVGVATTLAALKIVFELCRNRPLFQYKAIKIGGVFFEFAFDFSMAAGVANYISDLLNGFSVAITPSLNYSIISGIGVLNIASQLAIRRNSSEETHNPHASFLAKLFFFLAKLYGSGIYSFDIGLFSLIFLLNAITNIDKSEDVTNTEFYTSLSFTIALSVIILMNKMIRSPQQHHAAVVNEEEQPLLPHPENSRLSKCWTNFWCKIGAKNPEQELRPSSVQLSFHLNIQHEA